MRDKEDKNCIACWVRGVVLVGMLSPVLLMGCSGRVAVEGGVEDSRGLPTSEVVQEQTAPMGRQTSYSRVQLFSSLEEMSDDSEEVVVVRVNSQKEVYDIDEITPFVLTYVTVEEGHKGTLKPGDEIVVRQTGFAEESLLENGSSYLLYLVTSGLDGELASHYYINGVTAGIYQAESATTRSRSQQDAFRRVDSESGDELPSVLDEEDVEAAI